MKIKTIIGVMALALLTGCSNLPGNLPHHTRLPPVPEDIRKTFAADFTVPGRLPEDRREAQKVHDEQVLKKEEMRLKGRRLVKIYDEARSAD